MNGVPGLGPGDFLGVGGVGKDKTSVGLISSKEEEGDSFFSFEMLVSTLRFRRPLLFG